MERDQFEDLIHFAEINSMMEGAFIDVVNEYLTTKANVE